MGILNRLRDILTQPSNDDAYLYGRIAEEMEAGAIRKPLMAKALAESNFDEKKSRAIYMRMAVKALESELRVKAAEDEAKRNYMMAQAFSLYNEKKYNEAIEGLFLLTEAKRDGVAMACLASIAWHGLSNEGVDKEAALKLLAAAETQKDGRVRNFVGSVCESIDWKRSLANYDYAATLSHPDAASRALDLRKRLQGQGLLPKPQPSQAELAAKQAQHDKEAMDNAFDLYNNEAHAAAREGLQLLVLTKSDPMAMVCLGDMLYRGLGVPINQQYALTLFSAAEKTQDPFVRKCLGLALQQIDGSRALKNLEFASKNGEKDAKEIARELNGKIKLSKSLKSNVTYPSKRN